MRLKKFLAVALAATTALSSGVAYDLLGGVGTAEARSGYQNVDDVITVTPVPGGVTYTFKVTKPILDGMTSNETNWNKDDNACKNGVYENGTVKREYDVPGITAAQDAKKYGLVTLTSVSIPESLNKDGLVLAVPETITGSQNGATATSADYKNWQAEATSILSTTTTTGGVYYVTAVDLDGENTTYGDKVSTIALAGDANKHLEKFKADGFKALTGVYSGTPVSSNNTTKNFSVSVGENAAYADLPNVKTFDVSETKLKLDKVTGMYNVDKLEVIDVKKLDKDVQVTSGATLDLRPTTGTYQSNLKSVDISQNSFLNKFYAKFGRAKGTTLNVSEDTGLTDFQVAGLWNDGVGVRFITDGSTESYDLDLSFVNNAQTVKVNTNLRGFTAPSFADNDDTELDISDNNLRTVSLSGASNARTVRVNNNYLIDCDISGLSKATFIDVQNNYLTALDATSLEEKKPTIKMDGNYISSTNLSKGDKQTNLSLGTQDTAQSFKWAFTGDMGKASGSDSKAYIKLGGTGTLTAFAYFEDVPEGFAEKIFNTTSWTEANTADTSAITLGESAKVEAVERDYDSNGLADAYVTVSTAVTGNATKTAAEKVTFQYGNTKKDINIGNDNVVLVNYDVTSAIESENTKTKNSHNKQVLPYAPMYFPTEAFILNSNGTVDATLTSGKPYAWPDSYDYSQTEEKQWEDYFRNIKGVTFTKWNTAADGSGTAVSAGSKLKAIDADTTVYANYTENVYNIAYGSVKGTKADLTVTGSTAPQNGNKFGDDVTLNTNGYSTSSGNYHGWRVVKDGDSNGSFISEGTTVSGLTAADKKSESIRLEAIYGDANHYTNADKNSIDLVVGDPMEGYCLTSDLKIAVTGDPTLDYHDGQLGVNLGYDVDWNHFEFYSSDKDVVTIGENYVYAEGAGTATVYARDLVYGNMASITVNVQSREEAAAAAELKKAQAAANKSIAAGEKTDVSQFAKFAAEVVKNADGEDTVTVTKGKNVKIAKINTITIGDKTYTVTRIGANAYKGMSKLTTVTTSNKVKVIGKAAFANCKKLTKVTLGKAVVKIGANAFKNDKKLAKILIKSKKLTKKARVGKNSFKGIKATAKFYIAKKAATYKKVKKAIKAQSGAPKKATYVKKYA